MKKLTKTVCSSARAMLTRSDRTAHTLEGLEPRLVMAFDPSGSEQYMLELLNRFRANPAAELGFLTNSLTGEASSDDADVDSALDFFNVSGPTLASQWAALNAVPPLAWSENLFGAASLHNQAMIDADTQTHQAPGEPALGTRATNAGYAGFSSLGENVFAFGETVFHAHAAFAIDWGTGPSGIQSPPGHRNSMLSTSFREVGISIHAESDTGTEVGPLVITQDFGNRFSFGNPWLLGVVYDDSSEDGYTSGDGLGEVLVHIEGTSGTFETTTLTAGGYQIQVPAGTYNVTFSGGSYGAGVTFEDVVVGSSNRKLDAEKGDVPPAPEIEVAGNGIVIADGDTTPVAEDHTSFGGANVLGGEIVRTFTIRNTGDLVLNLSGSPRVVISGTNSSDFTVALDAPVTVDAAGNVTFQVRFDPSAEGQRNAVVTITSDDLDEATYNFSIRGSGLVQPEIDIKGKNLSIADGDTTPSAPDNTTFGPAGLVGQTKTRIFQIWNHGSSVLNLTGGSPVTITGAGAADFTLLQAPAGSINPGESTIFKVRFNPSALGLRAATITVLSNDANEAVYTFAVQGSGVLLPEIDIRGNGVSIVDGDATPVTSDWTRFGSTNVTAQTRVRTFTIANTGPGALNISGSTRVVITGANAGDFTVILQPVASVASGGQTTFRVRFNPSALGLRLATLTLLCNDASEATYNFNIAGLGV